MVSDHPVTDYPVSVPGNPFLSDVDHRHGSEHNGKHGHNINISVDMMELATFKKDPI
ncbi:hypothetical protein [Paenibacillus sp. NPDC055715]